MEAFTQRVEMEDDFDASSDPVKDSSSQSSLHVDMDHTDSNGLQESDVMQSQDADQHQSMAAADHAEIQRQNWQASARRRQIYEAPEFTRRLNVFEEVEPGGTVSFECQVRAFPRPIIKWYKDDVEMTFPQQQQQLPETAADETSDSSSNSEYQRVWAEDSTSASGAGGGGGGGAGEQQQQQPGILRLVINDANKDDEGAYRCKAENEEGVAATTGYLSVTGPVSSSQQQQQSSPRSINAVSTPPLLRAITEQQSMEEREAAEYQSQLNNDEELDDSAFDAVQPTNIMDTSSPDWSYLDYLKAAGIDTGASVPATADSGSDTSLEADTDDVTSTPLLQAQVVSPAFTSPATVDQQKNARPLDDIGAGTSPEVASELPQDVPAGTASASVNVYVFEQTDQDEESKDDDLLGGDGSPSGAGMMPLQMGPPVRPTADQGDVGYGAELSEGPAEGPGVAVSPAGDSSGTMSADSLQSFQAAAAADEVRPRGKREAEAETAKQLEKAEDDVFPDVDEQSPFQSVPVSPSLDDVLFPPSKPTTSGTAATSGCTEATPSPAAVPLPAREISPAAPSTHPPTSTTPTLTLPEDLSGVLDASMEWFRRPWIFYVLLVVAAALVAAALDADPSKLVLAVGLASFICFVIFQPGVPSTAAQ